MGVFNIRWLTRHLVSQVWHPLGAKSGPLPRTRNIHFTLWDNGRHVARPWGHENSVPIKIMGVHDYRIVSHHLLTSSPALRFLLQRPHPIPSAPGVAPCLWVGCVGLRGREFGNALPLIAPLN